MMSTAVVLNRDGSIRKQDVCDRMDPTITTPKELQAGTTAKLELLSLPLEMRYMIYDELLYPKEPYEVLPSYNNGEGPELDDGESEEDFEEAQDQEDGFEEKADEENEIEVNGRESLASYKVRKWDFEDPGDDDVTGNSDSQDGSEGNGASGRQPHTEIVSSYTQRLSRNHISTAILRVNKQIHAEALRLLYKDVHCILSLHTGGLGEVLQSYLFHDPLDKSGPLEFTSKMTGFWGPLQTRTDYRGSPNAEEVMNLPSLRWMRHLKVEVSWSSIFGQDYSHPWCSPLPHERPDGKQCTREYHFAHTGTLLLQVLRHLDSESPTKGSAIKELHLEIGSGDSLKDFVKGFGFWELSADEQASLFADARLKGLYEGTMEIIRTLRSIKKSRGVLVEETLSRHPPVEELVLSDDWETMPTHELDWEGFPWAGT